MSARATAPVRVARHLQSGFPPPRAHIATLHDLWEAAISEHAAGPALGWRARQPGGQLEPAFTWLSYEQAAELRTAVGSGLLQLGLSPGDALGLAGLNCKEWVLADAAAAAYSLVPVPLYESLGAGAVEHIASHAELAAVGCSAAVLPCVLAALPACPSVRVVFAWGAQPGGESLPGLPPGVPAQLLAWDQVVALGRRHRQPHVPPSAADTATICYTSGTTGVPKGVVLSHGNLIADVAAMAGMLADWRPGERHLSHLPLAHIFERKNVAVAVAKGGAVGFGSGNAARLLEDVQALQPHVFSSVPRLWNRIHARLAAQVAAWHPLRRRLFQAACAQRAAALAAGDAPADPAAALAGRLLFAPLRAQLGGRLKYATSGGSPLSGEVLAFLRAVLGCEVLEGYGMTEASCTIAISRPGDPSIGHVGPPLPCVELRLVDAPELRCFASDSPHPRGEVCVRGPTVFQGYHKDAAASAAVLDASGWLHTGDVGELLPGNRLRLIDRRKSVFKLAQGEYVAPEKVEAIYCRSPLVAHCFVHGDSLQARPVAVVVPDAEALTAVWRQQQQQQSPAGQPREQAPALAALCQQPALVQAVAASMAEQAAAAGLSGFEQAAAIRLVAQPFSVESGLLTPSHKLRRAQARAALQPLLDDLCAQLAAPQTQQLRARL